jgi:hypothetical protein
MSDEEIDDFEEVPFLCQINKSVTCSLSHSDSDLRE